MELTLLQYIASITPLLILLITLLRPVRAWVIKLWGKTVGYRAAQLDRIEAELHPNGGTSIKDSLNRIERTLAESDAFMRAQLNIHSVAVIRTNIKGKVTQINRQYIRLLGYSLPEVSGDGWINSVHPSMREKVTKDWADCIASKREYSDDILYITASGEELEAHCAVYRELDSSGTLYGFLGVITPIIADSNLCPHIEVCKAVGAINILEK